MYSRSYQIAVRSVLFNSLGIGLLKNRPLICPWRKSWQSVGVAKRLTVLTLASYGSLRIKRER